MPYDPFPSLPLYMEEGVPGVYYYDTTGYGGGWSMDDPPSPGGLGGSGSPEYGGVTNPPLPNFTLIGPQDYAAYTNLYLTITNVGSNTYVTLGSTLSNLTYIVLTNDNLADSNGWGIYTNLVATTNITPLPPMDLGTNTLFFNAALVWCTCPNPSALPDWESMLYYNSLCVPVSGGYITNGLVAYWRLNDGSGDTAADSSGNGLTLPLIGSPSWQSNYDLVLNGITQYGDISGTNALLETLDTNNITICAWINQTSSAHVGIVNKFSYTTNNKGWSFQVTADNQLDWFIGSGNDITDSGPGAIPLGQWTFVAATWSLTNSAVTYYIDGMLNSSRSPSASESVSGGADVQVGNVLLPGTNDFCFDGSMRDVAIYSRVLSSNEILTNFLDTASSTNVPFPNLLYYAMAEAPKTNPLPVTLLNSATNGPTNGTMYVVSEGSNQPPEWKGGLGSVSNGLHFNGQYSYLDSHDSNSFSFTTNSFSINAWVRPYNGGGYVMGNNAYLANGWFMIVGGNKVSLVAETTNGEAGIGMVDSLNNWPADDPYEAPTNWNMVTVTRNGTNPPTLYINALPVAMNGTFPNPIASTNDLIFGSGVFYNAMSNAVTTNHLDGDLWQPQVWPNALDPAVIYILYTNQLSGTNWPAISSSP